MAGFVVRGMRVYVAALNNLEWVSRRFLHYVSQVFVKFSVISTNHNLPGLSISLNSYKIVLRNYFNIDFLAIIFQIYFLALFEIPNNNCLNFFLNFPKNKSLLIIISYNSNFFDNETLRLNLYTLQWNYKK